jgi:hypothetical protein
VGYFVNYHISFGRSAQFAQSLLIFNANLTSAGVITDILISMDDKKLYFSNVCMPDSLQQTASFCTNFSTLLIALLCLS